MTTTRCPRAAWALVALASLACDEGSQARSLPVPPSDGFAPVSTALGMRCGSLDCHGRVEQNMRLYGELGLRLSADDVPAGDETTSEEHAENYFAVVALEPELLSDVWRDAGNGSQRLSLVRKARGDEAHKGGSIFVAGQPGDRCIQSWLSGEVDSALCEVAAELPTSPFAP